MPDLKTMTVDTVRNAVETAKHVLVQVQNGDDVFVGQASEAIAALEGLLAAATAPTAQSADARMVEVEKRNLRSYPADRLPTCMRDVRLGRAADAPLADERETFRNDMIAAGAKDYGNGTWEWGGNDFLFQFWQQARSEVRSLKRWKEAVQDNSPLLAELRAAKADAERFAFVFGLVLSGRWNKLYEMLPPNIPDCNTLDDVRARIDGFQVLTKARGDA